MILDFELYKSYPNKVLKVNGIFSAKAKSRMKNLSRNRYSDNFWPYLFRNKLTPPSSYPNAECVVSLLLKM